MTALEYLRAEIEKSNLPEEHFENEIAEMMEGFARQKCEEQKDACANNAKAFFKTLSDEWGMNVGTHAFVDKDSIKNTKNVCDYDEEKNF